MSSAEKRLRLLIVDDEGTIRSQLRTLAEGLGADVVGEADNGRSGIDEAERLRPEILLLDVSMPVMSGFDAARELRDLLPDMWIIFVSHYVQKGYAEEAMRIGARAYVVKGSAAAELGEAIDAVASGNTYVSTRIAA